LFPVLILMSKGFYVNICHNLCLVQLIAKCLSCLNF
jgi:hypothetical protein